MSTFSIGTRIRSIRRSFKRDKNLLGGLNTFDGAVTHPAFAEAHGLPLVTTFG